MSLQPARSAERTPSAVHLSIAGIHLALSTRDLSLVLALDEAMGRFLVPVGTPDTIVTVGFSDEVEIPYDGPVFDSGGVWRLYRDGTHHRFVFSSTSLGPLPYKEATFNSDFTSGKVTLRRAYFDPAGSVFPLEYPLDELLVQGLLVRGRGAELHGCGIVDESGRGLLFVGQSGAGKTTMARLWQNGTGVRILSDDRIIVRRAGRGFVMYGTPWHGEAELSEPGSAPLAGVFFLAHDVRNVLVPLTVPEATARLLACGFPPFYDRDGTSFTVGFLGEVAAEVPCRELRFSPDATVVRCVQAWVGTP